MKFLLLFIFMISVTGFIKIPSQFPSLSLNSKPCNNIYRCHERIIFKKYLIALRKTRLILKNNTNINAIASMLEFLSIPNNQTEINNVNSTLKNITVGNMILDVSNVKYVYIKTQNDKLFIELDTKVPENTAPFYSNINNIELVLNAISDRKSVV